MTTLGVLGGGQLGRMLALAGAPLGLRFRFLDPSPAAPARHLGDFVDGAYEDPEALRRFVQGLDLVTYEFENVPVETARFLGQRVPVFPPPAALEAAQDRLAEKTLFRRLGIPTPAFVPVGSKAELKDAVADVGVPAVLKTRRFGYDGKGQVVLRHAEDADRAWDSLGGVPLILESFVPFDREVSVLAVRGRDGQTALYPLVENRHAGGILRLSQAPAPLLKPTLQAQAEQLAGSILDELGYVGVLAVELFEHDGRLLANEIAPRVHNSGHWTIEGAATSQFANHLRAVLGWPLGDTAVVGHAAMVNLIGSVPLAEAVLRLPGTHLHLYGKAPRPGRKLGHITVTAADRPTLESRLAALQAALPGLFEWPA
jgi:5-(carboxyamino)imidazole ribonucleotide synthase